MTVHCFPHQDPFHLKEMPALHEQLSKMGHLFNPFHNSLDQIHAQLQSAEGDLSKEALQNMDGQVRQYR